MKTVDLLEKEILALPQDAQDELLQRLTGDSEVIALQREKEWDNDPSLGMTLEELKASVKRA